MSEFTKNRYNDNTQFVLTTDTSSIGMLVSNNEIGRIPMRYMEAYEMSVREMLEEQLGIETTRLARGDLLPIEFVNQQDQKRLDPYNWQQEGF